MESRNVESYISYSGKEFWSFYPAYGMRTVQKELEDTLSEVCGEKIEIKTMYGIMPGSSVKAMPIYYSTSSGLSPDEITKECNLRFSKDIRISYTRDAVYENGRPPKKLIKEYEYCFINSTVPVVLPDQCGCQITRRLDLDAMREAAYLVIGEYDFSSFTTEPVRDPYRTIYAIDIDRKGSMIIVHISGTGFLKNMIQMLIGELVRIGLGEMRPEEILDRIALGTPDEKAPEMPVRGLVLNRAYPPARYEDIIHNCSDFADYYVVQKEAKNTGCVYVIIMHCQDEQFARLVNHIVHQAYLDQVEHVYILDKKKGRLNELLRLEEYQPEYCAEIPWSDALLEFDVSGDWFLMKR